jgi:hypothetical protein
MTDPAEYEVRRRAAFNDTRALMGAPLMDAERVSLAGALLVLQRDGQTLADVAALVRARAHMTLGFYLDEMDRIDPFGPTLRQTGVLVLAAFGLADTPRNLDRLGRLVDPLACQVCGVFLGERRDPQHCRDTSACLDRAQPLGPGTARAVTQGQLAASWYRRPVGPVLVMDPTDA